MIAAKSSELEEETFLFLVEARERTRMNFFPLLVCSTRRSNDMMAPEVLTMTRLGRRSDERNDKSRGSSKKKPFQPLVFIRL